MEEKEMINCNLCKNKMKHCSECINNISGRKDYFSINREEEEEEAKVYRAVFITNNNFDEEKLYILKNGICIVLTGKEVNTIRDVCNEKMNWII